MNRAATVTVLLMALATGACGGGEGGSGSSLTGPTAAGGGGSQTPSGGCSGPSAPASLAVSTAGTSVMLTWSGVGGATEYLILVGTTPSSSNTLLTNTTQTNYPWSGVSPGTYYARVQAKNGCSTSGSSNEVTFTIS